jgi:serine protease inhibitor
VRISEVLYMTNTTLWRTATLAACALAVGCSSATEPRPEPVRELTSTELRVASSSTTFGLELFASVATSEVEPNVLVSPLSASMALGMTMNGARAGTLAEMRAALGFADLSQAQINAAYRGLIAQLRARDTRVEFRLANSLWHERSFNVLAPFIDSVRTNFDAQVTALDFAAPAAVRTINQWAADRTGGRIRDLLDSIDPLEKMFLVNAVYFKAPWTRPFMTGGATQPRPFRTLAGATVDAPTMVRDETTTYLSGDGVHLVELPYADGAFSMVLLMPLQAEQPLSAIVQQLTPDRWSGWLDQATSGRLMLQLPKFRFDYGTDLSDALGKLGMVAAFDPNISDFSGINNERDDIYITRVEQKAFIDVHELGTEAAAATAVGVGVTSMPPSIHFDRPFIFAIREASSGAILFIGRIGDPTL